MSAINNHLFVYGTLLRLGNEFAGYLQKHCTFYADGKFKGLLFDIGDYPGALLLPYGDAFVYGSIFLMEDADEVLKVLDDYEGFGDEHVKPNEFVRELIYVDGMDCWVYLYNRPVDGLRRIESGRYQY